MKAICRLFFTLFITSTTIYASQLSLPESSNRISRYKIYGSQRDASGYMWFATPLGVDRLNGSEYRHYRLIEDNESANMRGVTIGCDSLLYAYTTKSLFRYSPQYDRFERLRIENFDEREVITSVDTSLGGAMWVSTTRHLYYLDGAECCGVVAMEGNFSHTSFDESRGDVWVATRRGVYIFSRGADGAFNAAREERLSSLDDVRVVRLLYDNLTSQLWIGTFSSGLYRYDTMSGELVHYNEMHQPIRSISKVGDDEIWVGIDGAGIYLYDRLRYSYRESYSADFGSDKTLPTNSIYHIYEDDSHVWISTYTSGVFLFDNESAVEKIYGKIDYLDDGLHNTHINAIEVDDRGRVWFGTNNGVSRYNPMNDEWHHFLQDGNNRVILDIEQDDSGNVWLCGYACDIMMVDRFDNIVKPHLSEGDNKHYIYAIDRGRDGVMWFGGIVSDTFCYSPSSGRVERCSVRNVVDIIADEEYTFFATSRGVYQIEQDNERRKPIFDNKIGVQAIALSRGDSDYLWVGTRRDGVIRYDLSTKECRYFTREMGLSSNQIYGLLLDRNDNLWITSERDLNRLDINSGEITTYTAQHGLSNATYTYRSMTLMESGNIVVGTTNGAFEVNPEKLIAAAPRRSNIRFEQLTLFNEGVEPKVEGSLLSATLDMTESIEFKHNENSFTLSFVDLENIYGRVNNFRYKLKGFDRDWSMVSSRDNAVYTNVPPGRYIFSVRSYSANLDEYISERNIEIRVLQPWWNMYYAWVIYIIIGVILVRQFVRQYRRRAEERRYEQKLNFILNIAHDIRTPLTLVKAPLSDIRDSNELSNQGEKSLALVSSNIDKTINMISQLLDFQRAESDAMKLNVEQTSLYTFVESNIEHFISLADRKDISLRFTNRIEREVKGYVDQDKLILILDNLLSNAIKYTPRGGSIEVSSRVENEILYAEVKDSGIGIAPKAQQYIFTRFYRADNAVASREVGSGLGLMLTKKIVTIHKGDISFTSTLNMGTTFSISIPLSASSYTLDEISNVERISHIESAEGGERFKLMVVEDSSELRNYLAESLSAEYDVVACSDGAEALESIPKSMPDFIISDVVMPNLSGFELVERLKSNIETCHIPIILLTSLTQRDSVVGGYRAGADDYLSKPFDPSVLKAKITTIIKNRELYHKKYIDKSIYKEESSVIGEVDREFMSKLIDSVETSMMNSDFSINGVASQMAISRSVLFRKIKSLTNQSPQDFIRDIKMKRAATLLCEGSYSIADIAFMTGYPNSKYFSAAFKKYYGTTPREYRQKEDS